MMSFVSNQLKQLKGIEGTVHQLEFKRRKENDLDMFTWLGELVRYIYRPKLAQ